jgi:hypothetical protein
MSFDEEIEEAEQETSSGSGGWIALQVGDNLLRILSEPKKFKQRFGHGICYEGAEYCDEKLIAEENKEREKEGKDPIRLSVKFLTWAWDYSYESLKLFSMPFSVAKQLSEFKREDPEQGYGFSGWPIPYDINIKNTGKGGDRYTVVPAKNSQEISEEVIGQLEMENTPEEVIESMEAKARRTGGKSEEPVEHPTAEDEDINPDDIPF